MIPKHHFLLYWTTFCKFIGPPIKFWGMHQERLHRPMKKQAQTINNFINLPLSLATTHQYNRAVQKFREERSIYFGSEEDEDEKFSTVKLHDVPLYLRISTMFRIDAEAEVKIYEKFQHKGTYYESGNFIVSDVCEQTGHVIFFFLVF